MTPRLLLLGGVALGLACSQRPASPPAPAASASAARQERAATRLLALSPDAKGALEDEVRAAVERMTAAGDTRLALPTSSAQVQCVDLAELPDVVVCVFNTARFMNYALNRASEWVEVAHRGTVPSDREHTGNPLNTAVEGHNLSGADLRAFDRAWTAARGGFEPVDGDDAREKLTLEREFWDAWLRPRLAKSPDLVLLAVAAGTDVEGTLSHEILHAQWLRTAEMRRVVSAYWDREVPAPAKDAVTRALRANYAVDADPELLVNEFQAYVLMHRAEDFDLAAIAKDHRDPLLRRLAEARIEPLRFRLEAE